MKIFRLVAPLGAVLIAGSLMAGTAAADPLQEQDQQAAQSNVQSNAQVGVNEANISQVSAASSGAVSCYWFCTSGDANSTSVAVVEQENEQKQKVEQEQEVEQEIEQEQEQEAEFDIELFLLGMGF